MPTYLTEDEFVGPFTSWLNVQTDYGAIGDGVADDTTAIQTALDDLGVGGSAPVLYFPAGTYKISVKLELADRIGVTLVGHDPADTSLAWYGSAGVTMLWLNGVAYSQIRRLTFDGRSIAGTGVDQSYDGVGGHFDTGNEYADCVFQDADWGLTGGWSGFGFAETSVMRCAFYRLGQAGLEVANANALNLWAWYCLFEDCARGVANRDGLGNRAGNFRVYHSLFSQSTVADIDIGNTDHFSIRHCMSIGSARFLDTTFSNNPCHLDLQGNIILDPVQDDAIHVRNHGPLYLVDTTIRSLAGASGPVVVCDHGGSGNNDASDAILLDNTFTVTNPTSFAGRSLEFGTQVVDRSTITTTEADHTLINTPQPASPTRTVYEPVGFTGTAIQAAIDAAVNGATTKPIVHLPFGVYSVSETITIPAQSDLQLVGDGHQVAGTWLAWSGGTDGPILAISGPTKVIVRDVGMDGGTQVAGLSATGLNQPSAAVRVHRLETREVTEGHVVVATMAPATVDFRNVGLAYRQATATIHGLRLEGGGTTVVHCGLVSGLGGTGARYWHVQDNSHLVVRDVYTETGAGEAGQAPAYVNLTGGSGTLIVQNSKIQLDPINGPTPGIRVQAFRGTFVSLLNALWDRIVIDGDGSAMRVLGLGMVGIYQLDDLVGPADYFLDTSAPAADARLLSSRQYDNQTLPGVASYQVPNTGTADAAWLQRIGTLTRAARGDIYQATAPGVTDLRLLSVWVAQPTVGVQLSGVASVGDAWVPLGWIDTASGQAAVIQPAEETCEAVGITVAGAIGWVPIGWAPAGWAPGLPILTISLQTSQDTHTAGALARHKTVAVAQVLELDTAQVMARGAVIRTVTRAQETDQAAALTVVRSRVLDLAAEDAIAQGIISHKTGHLQAAASSHTAQATTVDRAFAMVTATADETSLALTAHKTRLLGAAFEIDRSQVIARGVVFADVVPAEELDAAQAITWAPKIRQLGLITTEETVQAVSVLKQRTLGQVVTQHQAPLVTRLKQHAVDQALEANQAQSITRGGTVVSVSRALSTHQAQTIRRVKRVACGVAFEQDRALTVVRPKRLLLEQLIEQDIAAATVALKHAVLSAAGESDLAHAVTWAPKIRIPGLARDLEIATAMTIPQAVNLIGAREVVLVSGLQVEVVLTGSLLDERVLVGSAG